ncbi:major facilitator superfamily domain-containing protein 3-like [Exaiptasia diaphana]|uniref:Major facilitator superfamily domain-containing protein 3 n=1 Tax=Exaiptasia diaphana TaxID=2652724 RepID=A0A913XGQ3_EXADI|nr:major facilitator superfamily domain-containing protein 3-like [Exaiptasia diaphana]
MATLGSKFILLFFLYFAQGLPYGIQTKLIPILLRSNAVSLTKVGFSRILSLPWLFKVFIANFLNRFSTIWLWLALSFSGMALCCGLPGLLGTNITFVLLCGVFGLNVMAASQDIAVDTLALRILDSSDLGKGNIAQVVGYKTGALIGGGFLVWLSGYTSWDTVFLVLSIFYIICTVYAYTKHWKYIQHSDIIKKDLLKKNSPNDYNGVFMSVKNSQDFGWIVCFVFIYKLGEQGMTSMIPLYMLDSGFSVSNVGLIAGVITHVFSIIGSIIGGWMASLYCEQRNDLIHLLKWLSIGRLIPMATHCLNISTTVPMVAIILVSECILQLFAGIITTVTFTLMMQISKSVPTGVQATHFSILATFEVLGKLTMTSVGGNLVEVFGYLNYFLMCLALSVAVFPVLSCYHFAHSHMD